MNTQQMPAKRNDIRRLFEAPGSDRILVAMDYSQIELRVLAHMSQDEILIDAFLNDRDIHSTTGELISDLTYEEIVAGSDLDGSPEWLAREQAKTVNFGIVYGMTEIALSNRLRISRDEAKKLINDYFEGYPGIKRFMDEQVTKARRLGYVEDMYGRKRRLRNSIRSHFFGVRKGAERQAGNAPIQASAGSMLKHAIVELGDVLPKYDTHIVLQVHDELIFDCPRDISFGALEEIQKTMEDIRPLDVPVKVDIDIYPERWAEGVNIDEWFGKEVPEL